MRKFLSLSLSVLLALGSFSTFAACKKKGGNTVDSKKTIIDVQTYNGGVGKEWLEDVARAFETKYAEKSFEENKVGVKVKVDYCGDASNMPSAPITADVYFTELFDYYQMINANKVADISDVVTGSLLAEFGENKTIESKLSTQFQDYFKKKDGKYYALPFFDGFVGLIYDVDWFKQNKLFFSSDTANTFTGNMSALSVGPDGVAGTFDDGMPATYDQFSALIAQMTRSNGADSRISSPTKEGSAEGYWVKYFISLWTNYQGKDSMLENWDVTSNAEFAEMQKQAGKKSALEFINKIASNADSYTELKFEQAQKNLIATKLNGVKQKIGLLLDGVWWENEAVIKGAFETYQDEDGDVPVVDERGYKYDRNFAIMPAPRANDQSKDGYKNTLYSDSSSFCFINKDTKGGELDAAKLFLQFAHTDEQLSAFTVKTSIPRCLNYTVSAEDKAKMTTFGKSVMEMKELSDVVYPYSGTDYYVQNSGKFDIRSWACVSKVGTKEFANPFIAFKNGSVTVEQYYNGLFTKHS